MSRKMSRQRSEQSFSISGYCNNADVESKEKSKQVGGSLKEDVSYPVAAASSFTHTMVFIHFCGVLLTLTEVFNLTHHAGIYAR